MRVIDFNDMHRIVPTVRIVIDRTAFEGWSVPERTILDQELVLILDGKGSFTVEGVEYPIRPGMLFYFYPHLVHSAVTRLDPPMHFLAVHFSFALAKCENEFWDIDSSACLLPLKPVTVLNNHHKAVNIFSQLYKAWEEKRPGYEWQLKILFQNLLFEFLIDLNNPPEQYANIKKIEKVLNYIGLHYTEHITVSGLCAFVGLSRGYFSEIFKSITGKTVVDYVNQVRIDHSKDLLANTPLKVKDIAQRTGFTDEFYFARVFKKFEGLSPSDFRKQFFMPQ